MELLSQRQAIADVSIATLANVRAFGIEMLFIFICVCDMCVTIVKIAKGSNFLKTCSRC